MAASPLTANSENAAILMLQAPMVEPSYPTVPSMILAGAMRHPDRVAVVEDEAQYTYRQLVDRAHQIGSWLRARGVQRGDVVALSGRRDFEMIASILGVWLVRAVFMGLDADSPPLRAQRLLREARARWLVGAGPGLVSAVAGQVDGPEHLGCAPVDVAPTRHAQGAGAGPVADDPAYIFFTSGTTAAPKGVRGTHKGISHFVVWERDEFEVTEVDRCALFTPIEFDVCLREICVVLIAGGALLASDTISDPQERATPLKWAAYRGMTLLHIVPSCAQEVIAGDMPGGAALPPLRCVLFAGEPLTDALISRWRALNPELVVANLYGPSETTLAKAFHRCDSVVPGVQPIGMPLPSTQIVILDATGQPCPAGQPGEIVIRTPFRTEGYINNAQEQARRFVPNPWRDDPTDLLYRTGDRGRVGDGGVLEIFGRLDEQTKVGGRTAHPAGVNAHLARHPSVHSSAVIAARDAEADATGVAAHFFVAYVVMMPGRADCMLSLKRFLLRQLPPALVPKIFVEMDALPRTPTGKVDRRRLPRCSAHFPAGETS